MRKIAFCLTCVLIASSPSVGYAGIQVNEGNTVSQGGTLTFGGGQENVSPTAPTGSGIRTAPVEPASAVKRRNSFEDGSLLDAAAGLRAKYREKREAEDRKAVNPNSYRLGFVVAFFDSESLVNPVLIKGLDKLDNMNGIKFKLFRSKENLTKKITDFSESEIKKLENLEIPMARTDTGGKVAKNYKVTKFPTILYETPSGKVVKFYTPTTMENVFRQIKKEKKKLAKKQR